MNRADQYLTIHKEAFDLFKRKNKDYGDSFATYGSVGVLVRMGDKIQRLMSVSKNNIQCVDDECLKKEFENNLTK